MGYKDIANVAYGMRVELPEGVDQFDFCEENSPRPDVAPAREGAWDEQEPYLFIKETWKCPKPGQATFITPYRASEEPYLTWDAILVEVAERMNVKPVGEPAWIFVPSTA